MPSVNSFFGRVCPIVENIPTASFMATLFNYQTTFLTSIYIRSVAEKEYPILFASVVDELTNQINIHRKIHYQ
uniref:Uncharacterized protein n=1 Tax=Parascaris equorum TaxID=6256 RepID=A0A914RCV4_PAREQ